MSFHFVSIFIVVYINLCLYNGYPNIHINSNQLLENRTIFDYEMFGSGQDDGEINSTVEYAEEKLENYLSNEENMLFTEKVKLELRQLFGVKWNFPDPFKGTLEETPQYMTELYKSVTNSEGVTTGSNPYNANIVRSYMEQSNYTVPGYFMFEIDFDEIELAGGLLEAELRVFRFPFKIENETLSPLLTPPYILLKVYQVTDDQQLETPDVQKLLNVQCVSVFTSGWQIFNVKQAVISWVSRVEANMGLLITATTLFGTTVPTKFSRRDFQKDTLQPVLVLYSGDDEIDIGNRSFHNISKRSTDISVMEEYSGGGMDATNKCQRKELYVNFTSLGWADFILAPNGYNAFNCKGICDFPLDLNQKPNNHATIKSLLFELKMENVTKPCCVPRTLLPLSVLYYQSPNTVVLKKYKHMIVKDCTCQ